MWTVPYILFPLVSGTFRDKGVRLAVDGQMLSDSEIKERGFKISLLGGKVDIRVPLGGNSGNVKVINKRLSARCLVLSYRL